MYEQLYEANASMSREVPGLQIAWDSTSLGLLKTCPRKYQLTMLEGWHGKKEALPLTFGILFHEALEHFDKLRAEGGTYEEARLDAVRYILGRSGKRTEEGIWKAWSTDCTKRNRRTLVRAIVWYLEHFKDDTAETVVLKNGKAAVELSFRMPIPLTSPEGDNYLLCGHMDRIVNYQGATYVLDYKTTAGTLSDYYFERYSPDNQVSLYTLAANVVLEKRAAGVIIDAVQLAVGFNRYFRGIVHRTKPQLDEWLHDAMEYIRLAERWAETGYWPMNDTACDKYGGCPFRGVCNKDPGVREKFLSSDFRRKVWDPLEVR